ncbi:MAG TPA: O-antigen ligase family protein, partial [Candidatus Dormibacteraeota bacterium]|nr:O-antigen ligase family protein [Candidatus Dormibacteraeota bacterium]
ALLASGYTFGLFAIAGAVVATLNGGGALPVSATIGNSNVAGTFLAMLMPLALYEVFDASSWSGRIVALNVVLVVGTTLLLTLSRSSWLGATVGVIVLAAGWRRLVPRLAPMAALVAAAAAVVMGGAGPTINRRLASIVQPADWGSRPHIWRDTLDMVASRPLFGYGPDNFGLVYPNYQTGAWEISGTGSVLQIDKAHAETLQVAATQGVVGLAAYVFILFALVRSFWRSGRDELSVALFAAVVAYQVTLQLNFTQVAAAIPFWIMVAAAAVVWERPSERYIATVPAGRETRAVIVSAGLVPAAVLATVLVAFPYLADASLRVAVESDFVGHGPDAIHAAQRAAQLVPYESVYQVEIGNLAFERGAWWDARSAYQLAATLGSYNPYLFRNLALVDINLGRREDALAAAEQALVLDRFDPATRALVDQLREDARTP